MTSSSTARRGFLKLALGTAAASLTAPRAIAQAASKDPLFKISLAEWSLNKRMFKRKGAEPLDHLDFCKTARSFGIDGVEYVNQMFFDKAEDKAYLGEMKSRQDAEGVKGLLIMVDREGNLGEPDEAKRSTAVSNHLKWLDAAAFLGCHSIRVNAASDPKLPWDEQAKLAADGLHRLCVEGDKRGLWVVVENHGGLSSNGKWLSGVMKQVNHPNCGTLPDFGNFRVSRDEEYDRYLGVTELMPFAKAVSAKSHDFDEAGNETHTDYLKMMKIVAAAGYQGWVGIEYEGSKLSEMDGIRATKKLLERVREQMVAKK
jgi:sugar phosphate isomerase/epimerase